MLRIDVSFLLLATVYLLAALVASLVTGFGPELRFRPVHADLLLGFASLATFGLTYRLYPTLQRSWLALPNLAASGAGGLVLPLGGWLAACGGSAKLAVAGVALLLAGVLLFAANLVWNVALPGRRTGIDRVVPWAA